MLIPVGKEGISEIFLYTCRERIGTQKAGEAHLADFWLIFSQGWKESTRAFLLRNVGPIQTGTHSFREMFAISGKEKMWGNGIDVGDLSLMAIVFLFQMTSAADLHSDLLLRSLELLFHSLSLPSCL